MSVAAAGTFMLGGPAFAADGSGVAATKKDQTLEEVIVTGLRKKAGHGRIDVLSVNGPSGAALSNRAAPSRSRARDWVSVPASHGGAENAR